MTMFSGTLAHVWGSILVHLWQSTLLLLPILAVWWFRKQAPTRFLEPLLWLGFVKLCLPFALCRQLAASAADHLRIAGMGDLMDGTSAAGQWIQTADAVRAKVLTVPDQVEHFITPDWALALTALYLTGLIALLTRWIRAWRRDTPTGHSIHTATAETQARLVKAIAGMRIPPSKLRITTNSTLPALTGLVRTRLLIPERVVCELTPAQLRGLILHEKAHWRRGDTWRDAAMRLAGLVFFFFPLVWPLLRGLREIIEVACDEAVLREGIPPREYARALARTLLLTVKPISVVGVAWLGMHTPLRRRMDRLAYPGRFPMMSSTHYVVLTALVLLLLSLSFWPNAPRAVETSSANPATRIALTAMSAEESAENAESDGSLESADSSAEEEPFDTPARLEKVVAPEYPEECKRDKVGGLVVLIVSIDADGSIGKTKVDQEIEGYPSITESVLEAMKQWVFSPATKDGKPVPSQIRIPFQISPD